MNALSATGYEQTSRKLAALEKRLAAIQRRTDLTPVHRAEVIRSYENMIRQYRRELKLYEAHTGCAQDGPIPDSRSE